MFPRSPRRQDKPSTNRRITGSETSHLTFDKLLKKDINNIVNKQQNINRKAPNIAEYPFVQDWPINLPLDTEEPAPEKTFLENRRHKNKDKPRNEIRRRYGN